MERFPGLGGQAQSDLIHARYSHEPPGTSIRPVLPLIKVPERR